MALGVIRRPRPMLFAARGSNRNRNIVCDGESNRREENRCWLRAGEGRARSGVRVVDGVSPLG